MNYDHAYHAGNFADVFKHVIILLIIEKLKQKPTPFVYIDSHAAYPICDLASHAAQKTQEAQQGIKKLLEAPKLSSSLRKYVKIVESFNPNPNKIRFYPGSGSFARTLVRKEDRIIVNDLMNEPYQELKKTFYHDAQVHCHQQDAYQLLKALVPPKEKRGLVLIDPPYENMQEFSFLEKYLPELTQRWAQGIYAVWYPIKNRPSTDRFIRNVQKNISLPMTNFVLQPWPGDVAQRLSGTGVLLINPPWEIDKTIFAIAKELEKIFTS